MDDNKKMGLGCAVIAALVLVIGGIAFFAFNNHRIDPGNVGILIDYASGGNAGKPVIRPEATGQYIWINPFSGQQLVEYPIAQQQLVLSSNPSEGEIKRNTTIACQMSGGGVLNIGLTVTWQVDAAHPEVLYLKKPNFPLTSDENNDINTTILYGAVRADTLNVCTRYTWQDILGDGSGPSKADLLRKDIMTALQGDMTPDGIIVNQVFLNERIPDVTINAVLNARNEAQKSAYLKQEAQYQADAAVAKAQGDAQSIAIINAQLSKSPAYLQYLEVKEWDGKLPQYLSTNGQTNPLLAAFGQAK